MGIADFMAGIAPRRGDSPIREEPEWLLWRARTDIRHGLRAKESVGERALSTLRDLSQPTNLRVLWLLCVYFGVLGVLALGAEIIQPDFFPAVRPLPGREGVVALWQVQAGLVAVALPFLFVLMPLVGEERFAATSTAQLLMADTFIYPILVFALGGVLWSGASVLWLGADAAKWLSFVFVLGPSVIGVAYTYVRAARIISDHDYVRRASQPLLLRMIDDYIIEGRGIEHANGDLIELLESHKFACHAWLDGDLVELAAAQTGVIADVDAAALADWLGKLPTADSSATAELQDDEGGIKEVVPQDPETAGYWSLLIGDDVEAGQSFVALQSTIAGGTDKKLLEEGLNRCLRIESDG